MDINIDVAIELMERQVEHYATPFDFFLRDALKELKELRVKLAVQGEPSLYKVVRKIRGGLSGTFYYDASDAGRSNAARHKEYGDEVVEYFSHPVPAEYENLRKDAERYRWLRMADWWDSPLCVVRNPAKQVKLGTDCPSRDRLDATIDAAMQGDNPSKT